MKNPDKLRVLTGDENMNELEEKIRTMIADRQEQLKKDYLTTSPNTMPTSDTIRKCHDAILSDPYINALNQQLLKIEQLKTSSIFLHKM